MGHVLQHLPATLTAPRPGRQAGDPRSANSAAPQGCVGQGMGSMPMSTPARPVPPAKTAAANAPAQGIVTRTGQDLQGLGGEAIEPGAAGMRPACWGACGVCDCTADAGACARKRSAGAGAVAAGAQAIPDGNHGDNNLTTVGDRS